MRRLFVVNHVFSMLVVLLVVLAACAPAATPAPAPAAPAAPKQPQAPAAPAAPAAQPTPTKAAAPAAPAPGTPQRGGTLRTVVNIEAPHFDPVFLNSVSIGERVGGTVYNRALRYKTGSGVDPNGTILEPDLAEKWEVSPDGKTITFLVRKGVKWQNVPPLNGRELTADDFIFSYNRLWKTPGSGQAPWFRLVEKIEATDKYTVKITMKQPSVTFLTLMGHTWSLIHPKEVVERDGDIKKAAIGTGPFILDKREANVITKLKKNPGFYDPKLPYLDGVDVFFIPDPSAIVASFRAGQLDVYSTFAKGEIDAITAGIKDVRVESKFINVGFFCKFHFDTTQPPWNNEKMRQAVSVTINRQAEIDTFFGGEGAFITVMSQGWKGITLPPGELGEGGKYWKRDLKLAEQLIKEAGYPVPFEVNFLHNLLFDARVARYVNDIQEGPFKLKVKPMPTPEYLTGPYIGKWPSGYGFVMGCGPAAIEPGQFLGALYDSTQTVTNNSNVNDPVVQKMLEEQEGMLDPPSRLKKLHEIQRYVATKMYYVPVSQGITYAFAQPNVMEYNGTISFNQGDNYRHIWIKK